MALKYNPITGELEEEKPVALSDLVFDSVLGEFKAVERKSVVKNESDEMLSQLKQTIRDLLEKLHIKPGVTTVQDMVRLGYKAKNSESYVFLSKSGSFLFSHDKYYIDRIDIQGLELPSNLLWSQYRKYADWCSLFRQLGFYVSETESPNQYQEYYSASFDAIDNKNGINLSILLFDNLKSSFSKELSVLIFDMYVKFDIKKTSQFNTWLYGTDNRVNSLPNHSERSYGITGDKTVKQIIESPLGDASVDYATATFDSLQEWIRRNGKLEEIRGWMYYRSVPTRLLGNKIDHISIFKNPNGFGVITHLVFQYSSQESMIKNLQDVIEFGKTLSNHLQDLGFIMKDAPLYDLEYDKFKREGDLRNRKVIVQITEFTYYSAHMDIWLYVNK